MPNDYFQFKQFTINQGDCAMKVGTDGVLLGAWANVLTDKVILDIGTGTGLIAIMAAQRSNAEIDAVEIEENACKQAEENVNSCKWNNRIHVYNNSIQDFATSMTKKYDHIVSNPPFFEKSLLSNNPQKNMARHSVSMNLKELISIANNMLTKNGKISLILPADSFIAATKIADNMGLSLSRLTKVKPRPEKTFKRVLLEFCNVKSKCKETEIVIEKGKRHDYTDDYINVTKDFYLAF